MLLPPMNGARDHYFPNTEPLAANEMRVIALGTGRPFVRRAQANCSWLIELGNGDKFIMDFGSGSQVNFTALEIPHQDITAYFATHLHADHVGDFAQVWIGSGHAATHLRAIRSRLEVWHRAFRAPADRILCMGHRYATGASP
jgi:ribonuclease BN (tRNA processing enzyme)